MDSGRRSGLDRFDPHVLALSLLFRMSELRQRVALICELSVFTQLLFFVALGPQMEVREQPRCKAEIVFLITINFANTPPLLFANFHQIAVTLVHSTNQRPIRQHKITTRRPLTSVPSRGIVVAIH